MDLNKEEIELLKEGIKSQIGSYKKDVDLESKLHFYVRKNKDGSYHKQDAFKVPFFERQQKEALAKLAVLEPLMEKLQNQ